MGADYIFSDQHGVRYGATAVREVKSGPGQLPFHRYLDQTGDGTGNADMAQNFASFEGHFRVIPSAGQILMVDQLTLVAGDDTATDWTLGEFVNRQGGLPNGIKFEYRFSDRGAPVVHTLWHNSPLRFNYNLFSMDKSEYTVIGTQAVMRATLDFTAHGGPLRLVGDNGDELRVTVNDDHGAVIVLLAFATGFYEKY